MKIIIFYFPPGTPDLLIKSFNILEDFIINPQPARYFILIIFIYPPGATPKPQRKSNFYLYFYLLSGGGTGGGISGVT